jgi:hypothetical protein
VGAEFENTMTLWAQNLKIRYSHKSDAAVVCAKLKTVCKLIAVSENQMSHRASVYETVAGSCEQSNEPSGSVRGGEFLN